MYQFTNFVDTQQFNVVCSNSISDHMKKNNKKNKNDDNNNNLL